MAFKQVTGAVKVAYYPKAASQAFTNGDLCYWNGSGYLIPADSTSGDHAGVIQRDVLSTDSDYANNTRVPVIIPHDDAEFEVPVNGTLTAAMVGNRYDLTDAGNVNVAAQAKKVVTITRFISSTKAWVKINAAIQNVDVATT